MEQDSGKIYIPLDFRGMRPQKPSIVFSIEDEEDEPCVRMDVFSDAVHVSIKLDDGALDVVESALRSKRLDLLRKIAFAKGCAHAARRRK